MKRRDLARLAELERALARAERERLRVEEAERLERLKAAGATVVRLRSRVPS